MGSGRGFKKIIIISLIISLAYSLMGYYCFSSCEGFGCLFCIIFTMTGYAVYILLALALINIFNFDENYVETLLGTDPHSTIPFHITNFVVTFIIIFFLLGIWYWVYKMVINISRETSYQNDNSNKSVKGIENKKRYGYLIVLVGGLISIIGSVLGFTILFILGDFSEKTMFIYRFGWGFVISIFTILVSIFLMKKDSTLKWGSGMAIVLGVISLNLIVIIGGFAGFFESKRNKTKK